MKAEEMFKNCGFEKLEENSEAIFYTSIPRYICGICFHKNTKEVSFEINNKDYHFTPNVFAAIAKQMAELGWIELMWRSASSIKYDDNLNEKMYEPIHNMKINGYAPSSFDFIGLCGVASLLDHGIYKYQPLVKELKTFKEGTKTR